MHATVVVFALSGFLVPAAVNKEPGWIREYSKAWQLGQNDSKPLAVFIGSGENGWNQVATDGRLAEEVQKLLVDNYVCVYVDTRDAAGMELASALEMTEKPGIVISSVSGREQAFRHAGNLDNRSLARYLRKFSDRELVVRFTEGESSMDAGHSRSGQRSYYDFEPAGYYPPGNFSTAVYINGSRRNC
jgi:hypothetical protein